MDLRITQQKGTLNFAQLNSRKCLVADISKEAIPRGHFDGRSITAHSAGG